MEVLLSIVQFNAVYLVLFVMGLIFLDYVVSYWSELKNLVGCSKDYYRDTTETPIFCRHLEIRHRNKLMAGVRRRLDRQF